MKVLWLIFLWVQTISSTNVESIEKLKAGLLETENSLQILTERWKILQFPNFLKSVAMPLSSWDILRSQPDPPSLYLPSHHSPHCLE
jgi:hypothetical protein